MIREARAGDVASVVALVRELAAYERAPDAVQATEEDFRAALFGERPRVFCHVAEADDGEVVGLAVWYVSFSTWTGRHGLWLEDLFVRPEHRGEGLGLGLLATLARLCVRRGYTRLEWWVLDWNEPALGFYRSLGAVGMHDWTVQRLEGDDLSNVAARAG